MIKFFRKIRQKLLSDQKFSKYLVYAFGEIILVVIGILIALQINNWNENQKEIKRERLFLKELKNSIDKDLISYNENYNWRLENKKNGLDSLLLFMEKDIKIDDALFLRLYGMISMDIVIRHDRGPYETLKSSGFDYIRNDTLRTAINRTYTRLPKLEFFASKSDTEYDTRINELEDKIGGIKSFENQGGWISPKYEIKVDNILSNQDFLKIYATQARKYRNYKSRLEQIKSALNELKSQIEEELKK